MLLRLPVYSHDYPHDCLSPSLDGFSHETRQSSNKIKSDTDTVSVVEFSPQSLLTTVENHFPVD